MQFIPVFLDIEKFADFRSKIADVSGTWFIYFLDLFQVGYNCAKFHHCRICVTDLREGGFLPTPLSVSSPEKAHPG